MLRVLQVLIPEHAAFHFVCFILDWSKIVIVTEKKSKFWGFLDFILSKITKPLYMKLNTMGNSAIHKHSEAQLFVPCVAG